MRSDHSVNWVKKVGCTQIVKTQEGISRVGDEALVGEAIKEPDGGHHLHWVAHQMMLERLWVNLLIKARKVSGQIVLARHFFRHLLGEVKLL